jgi:hypothetical protein
MKRPRFKTVALALLVIAMCGAVLLAVVIKHALSAEPSVEQCLGRPLPAGTHVIADDRYIRLFNGDRWFVIEMSEPQFREFCAKAGLKHRADLLTYWSSCFRSPGSIPWVQNVVNDQHTVG